MKKKDTNDLKPQQNGSIDPDLLFRQVIDSSQDGIIVYGTDLRYKVWNPAMEKISGRSAGEVIGKLPLEMFPFLKDTGIYARLEKALAGEAPETIDFKLDGQSGISGWYSDTSWPLKNEKGEVTGVTGVVRDITDRKTAEAALNESEQSHRRLLEALPDIVMRFDRDGRHLFVSGNVMDVVGFPAEQFIGKTHRDLGFPEDMSDFWEEKIRQVYDSGKIAEVEFSFDGIKGHVVFNWRLIPEVDSSGKSVSVLTIARDITAHRKAEREFTSLFTEMLDGFALHEIICDEHGEPVDYRFLSVNPSFERLTGLKGENITGRRVTEVLPGIQKHWIETYGRVALTGEPVIFENYSQELDKHFEVTAFQSSKGQFTTIFRDITESKKAELSLLKGKKELLMSEQRFRALYESTPVAVYETDAQGRCTGANPMWLSMADMTIEEALGDGWQNALHPDDRESVFNLWQQHCNGHQPWGFEYRFLSKSGKVTIVHGVASPVRNDSDDITGYIGANIDITELKQAEDKLRKSQTLLDETGRLAQVGGWEFDINTMELEWTREVFNIHELDPSYKPTVADAIGFYAPESQPIIEQAVQRAIDTGEPFDLELEIITAKGNRRWVHAVGKTNGKKGKVSGVFQDITESKLAENKIIENNKLIQDIVDNADALVYLADTEGRFLLANGKLQGLLGAEQEDIVGRTREAFFPREVAEAHRANDVRVIETGSPIVAEETESLGGEERTYLSIKFPVFNLKGEIYAVGGISTDITDRKKAERALSDVQKRMTTILNTVGDPIFVKDNEHRIIVANPAFYDIFCMKEEDVIGKSLVEAVPEDERKHFLAVDRAVLDTGEPDIREETLTVRNFTRTIITRKTRFVDDNGQKFLVGSIHDITQRKKAEEEARHLQAQLLQSQKMEAVGQLAGGMAHDFNNMLGVILSASELAKMDTAEDSPAFEELLAITDAVKKARELSMKLLTFARRDKLSVSSVEAGKIIDSVKGMLSRTIPKSVELKVAVKDNCAVRCDQNQIHQALLNICNNAVDAMPNGGPLVIEAQEARLPEGVCDECGQRLEGKYCLIQVADSGIGMHKEILSRITEPFYTTKGAGKGTGLGLSVTQGIIQSHNGHMHIYSEPGRGTCVKIYLPADEDPAARADSIADGKPPRGVETVLVVDDETQLLALSGRLLARNGYKPLLAESGAMALELYRERQSEIAVVVLDLMMPGMDGAEVNRRLKEINPDVKVIYASGFSKDGVAAELLKEKNRGFAQKPFEMTSLCVAIREMIDRAGGRD